MRYISLSLSGLSLTIYGNRFTDSSYPRLKAEQAEVARSAYGTIISYGRTYEDAHLWEFTALLKPDEYRILDAIYWEHHKRRRDRTDPKILLVDTTAEFVERSPRTRAKAASPFATETAVGASHIAYFAQFYAWFAARPEYSDSGKFISAQISLQETEVKVAP